MPLLAQLAAATSSAPTRLDPVELFLDADIVVQVVIVGLVLASIWVWMIIVSFSLRMGRVRRRSSDFEHDFWEADQPEALLTANRRADNPSARVAAAGLSELRTSTKDGIRDKEAARQRIALAMEGQVAAESDALAERLNFLATVGSVAPFIGLFAAIPAVMAYNRFSHSVNGFEARLQRFADRVHAQVGRELERS